MMQPIFVSDLFSDLFKNIYTNGKSVEPAAAATAAPAKARSDVPKVTVLMSE